MSSAKTIRLTDEQQKVVNLDSGIHLVLAPPGCGKTELLARRVEKAVLDGYNAEQIICLTFTNRAAKGMRVRVNDRFPDNKIFIGNIHNYCTRFLFQNGLIPPSTSILDEEDSVQLLEEAIDECDFIIDNDNKNGELLKLAAYITQINNSLPNNFISLPKGFCTLNTDTNRIICNNYIELKKKYNFIDFDDLLILTYKTLIENKDLYGNKFNWIQVDEIQDLNPLQFEIINLLSKGEQSVIVYFGDYEQSIFSFIGARLETIHKIAEICRVNPKNGIHNLQKNFRSPSYLLKIYIDYAKALLKPIWKKDPISDENSEPKPDDLKIFHVPGTANNEVSFITSELLPALKNGSGNTAVIVRYNRSADMVSSYLTNQGMSHFKVSGFDLFRRKSIKGLMAFLSVLAYEYDKVSWCRLFYEFNIISSLKESRKFVYELFNNSLNPQEILRYKLRTTELAEFRKAYRKKRVIVFDTETTGLNTSEDDIIQIAAEEIVDGVCNRKFNVYIDTNFDLQNTESVHNISKDFLLKNGVSHRDGLSRFLDFVGDDAVLMAHNLDFDFRILNSNLNKYLEKNLDELNLVCFDSLRISKIVFPNLFSYKLKDMLTYLKLEGVNSHNAIDDVRATSNLIERIYDVSEDSYQKQIDFIVKNGIILQKFIKHLDSLFVNYSSISNKDVSLSLFVNQYFSYLVEFGFIDKDDFYDYDQPEITKLIRHIDFYAKNDGLTSLKERINRYVPEYKTFKESDLYIGIENIVISTVHKAKGLEFENVIVSEVVDSNYPSWASKTQEEINEDARALYVAMTRAKKRLYLTYHDTHVSQYGRSYLVKPSPFLEPIRHHFR